jgi:hypothetical protein
LDARQAAPPVVRFTHGKTFADYQADEAATGQGASALTMIEALNKELAVE